MGSTVGLAKKGRGHPLKIRSVERNLLPAKKVLKSRDRNCVVVRAYNKPVRRLLIPLRSPLALALLPILLLLFPKALYSIESVIIGLSLNAFNGGFIPVQEPIIVMVFSIALVRSQPRISFISVTTITGIFFAALVIGELTSMQGEAHWEKIHERESEERLTSLPVPCFGDTTSCPSVNPSRLRNLQPVTSPTEEAFLDGFAGGLAAGLIATAWRWAPGMARTPVFRILPWVGGSGLSWGCLWAAWSYLVNQPYSNVANTTIQGNWFIC